MDEHRSSLRGRGRDIIGRGIDALFSEPDQTTKRSSQQLDTNKNGDIPVAGEDLLATAGQSPSTTTNQRPAGEGLSLSDDELLDAIDVPLGESENMADPTQTKSSNQARSDIQNKTPDLQSQPEQPPIDTGPVDIEEIGDSPIATPVLEPPPQKPQAVSLTPATQQTSDSIRPQSPFIRPTTHITDDQPPPRTQEEEARLLASLDAQRIADLHGRIDALYQQAPERVSNRPEVTGEILGSLRQARTILLEKPQDFVEAEYKIQQAYSLFNRVENAEQEGDKYGWRVFWYEVITFILLLFTFLVILAYNEQVSGWLGSLFGAQDPSSSIVTALGFWSTFVWGGIGGVVGAIYVLWTHVSQRQDFERQHVMWYIGQPLMGLILGGVTFLIINAGLLSLQGGEIASQALRNDVQFFPALVAFIAGFRPQFIFGLLVKIINVISPSGDEK